ncbi:2021_t:CDS:2 [Diversispora eburnea]|uniref:2021_t:CDS:1 n=1 Tax=Diversispora eburnea TaxID=1213867 RepID=A0A9N9FHK5_9GLOM|nr:2021_t:CDS:2 [Diversispora eburnea]
MFLDNATNKALERISNFQEKGNEAFVKGEFETARQEYAKGIEVTPKDPRLWSNRAQTFIELGYPELTIADAINSLSLIEPKIISGKYEDADMVLFCNSGWRKAEALANCDEYGSASMELERLSQISNRRPVSDNMDSDRYILIEQVGKMCKFSSRGAYPWDIRNQEHCNLESLASVQKLLDKISRNSIKVSLVSFPDTSQSHEFGIVATKNIKKGTLLFNVKPLISVHAPGQQRLNGESKSSSSSLLFVLKIFAIAKQRDNCPLDIEEIKHIFPFQHSTAWKTKAGSALLNPLTVTGQLYSIIPLFNHHCDSNASLSDVITKSILLGNPISSEINLSSGIEATVL